MTPATTASAPAVWIDGERQTDRTGGIPADDRGLLLADGAFETIYARGGHGFRVPAHLERLRRALDALAIPVPALLPEWVEAALRTTAAEGRAVRVTVTRGSGGPGLAPPARPVPRTIVSVNALPTFATDLYRRGVRVHVPTARRNRDSVSARHKTLAYTDTVAAWLEAQRAGADDILWLNADGHCTEGATSNLFVVTSGRLVTPPVSCGVLPGITRAVVKELAAGHGMTVVEQAFGLDLAFESDETFLTSTLRGIIGVTAIGGRHIGAGTVGTVTQRMSAAYADVLARECP